MTERGTRTNSIFLLIDLAMESRCIANDFPTPLSLADTEPYLQRALEDIVTIYGPRESYGPDELQGLLSGPTGLAYLFLHVSASQPKRQIAGQPAIRWARQYLRGSRGTTVLRPGCCGVASEKLAYLAVCAAVTKELPYVQEFLNAVNPIFTGNFPDEHLYGRAGTLYLLRLIRHWVPNSSPLVERYIVLVSDLLIKNGPDWRWHGARYLGAVHGDVGIITQLVLTSPPLSSQLEDHLSSLLSMQDADGNWPTKAEKESSSRLVQFCHGAPGILHCLLSIYPYFPKQEDALDAAIEKARDCVWKFGLLRKEPSLCHGLFGNALSLPLGKRRDHFLAFAVPEKVRELKESDPEIFQPADYGNEWSPLMNYLPSAAWTWLVCTRKTPKVFAFNDIDYNRRRKQNQAVTPCVGWNWRRREFSKFHRYAFDNGPLRAVAPHIAVISPIMNYGKKDEDADTGLVRVDRTQVFQEARLFNSSPIQPRQCRILLTKIALLLYTGEKFPTNEATTLFFGISKLFQNKDASLRQMVHLVIKELAHSAEDIIMVTSTIMKDTGGSTDAIFRPNAIRALCRIIDATTVASIERVMKTAIVDKNPSVSSAALVSSYHLLPIAKDVVRRWQSETQEAAASTKSSGGFSLGFSSSSNALPVNNSTMTQYHAIGLLYQMRMHDRMALVKMVQQFGAAGAVKNPAAIVMLVRLAAQLAEEDPHLRKPMMQLLDGWLRHKSEMVNFEAAKAICDMRDVTDAEVSQAVHVLQLFLTSPRAVTKFAALRILHNFASFKPQAVNVCNPDIELLISNSNRSIATFAITTLLKTGNEASVDRLMKQITGFMSEITDEFKITIVEAIRTLCLKFPSKQAGMLAFLSGILRDEGGYEFKRAVVESMFDLIKFVPESKEDALAHLCEFIEDCEFTKLAVRILHLLGMEGPKTSQPTKYIRYIYNRVVLENAIVRAAAVTALAKFGVGQQDPEVKRSVEVLLTRCLDDVDDEVRDRAALNLRLMSETDDMAQRFVKNDSMFSLPYFEHQLVMYVTSDDKSTFASSFDISKIPVVTREQADAEDRTKKLTATAPTLKAPKVGPTKAAPTGAEAAASATAQAQKYAQELMQIPEMKEFGSVLKSSPVVELTEAETEYVVSVIKHIFKEHVVLQYEIKNTLPATVLENVSVVASPSEDEELEEVFIIQAESLPTDEPGKVYVAFQKVGGEGSMPISTFSNVLKFTSKEIDPTTNEPEETGYDDEYEVAEFDLAGSDYVIPTFASNFNHIWEQVGAAGEEAEETLQLSGVKSIADATEQLAKTLSLQPLEGTDVPMNQTTHTLKLLGKTVNGGKVVANVRMAYSSKSGVTTKITVRSEEEGVAALVVASVA
ncbi:uncharacterized protein E0L32_005416 [Thyridium curvatum]|uniref:Gamma-coat protein n=1 Tax=Thyridium curvatum TaxID=1093900 RepID=A0A507AWW6_9PEZI|nr:uncharacterized protein E0L32_005416 [Thyridium curvatum]TPX14452.1 hypothetical protein E0L32_005416 [Thyridium curvatum]